MRVLDMVRGSRVATAVPPVRALAAAYDKLSASATLGRPVHP